MAHFPHLNDIFITERLKSLLSQIDRHPITTVIAPMGFGKTTAIGWWAKRLPRTNRDAVIMRQIIATDSTTDFWTGFCRAFRNYPKLNEQMKALGYPKDASAISVLAQLLSDALHDSVRMSIIN